MNCLISNNVKIKCERFIPGCSAQLDLVLLVDTSGSIRRHRFNDIFKPMIQVSCSPPLPCIILKFKLSGFVRITHLFDIFPLRLCIQNDKHNPITNIIFFLMFFRIDFTLLISFLYKQTCTASTMSDH